MESERDDGSTHQVRAELVYSVDAEESHCRLNLVPEDWVGDQQSALNPGVRGRKPSRGHSRRQGRSHGGDAVEDTANATEESEQNTGNQTALTLNSVGHAFWTIRQAVEERPAESHALRAEAKRFDDVGSSANPPVEVDLQGAISAAIHREMK